MKLVRLRLSNFRSFGADCTELDLDDLTFLLGPNGAGKTAVLQALARMFGIDPAQRRVRKSDFHVPHDEQSEQAPAQRGRRSRFRVPGARGQGWQQGHARGSR
jgi:putative ATP-dependent endonuclease of OLD family